MLDIRDHMAAGTAKLGAPAACSLTDMHGYYIQRKAFCMHIAHAGQQGHLHTEIFPATGVADVVLQLTVRVHGLQAVMGSVLPHAGTPETLLRFAPTLKDSLACRCAAAVGGAGPGAGHSACVASGWGPQECAGGNRVCRVGHIHGSPGHLPLVPGALSAPDGHRGGHPGGRQVRVFLCVSSWSKACTFAHVRALSGSH